MKPAFIQAHQAAFSLSRMCRVFEFSRGGFYEWLSRPESAPKGADQELSGEIEQTFERSPQTDGPGVFGTPCVIEGQRVRRERFGRLMRQQGLHCKTRRR